ncbi:MAG: CsbD family protein [Alphaproteobacteria bacterium]
MNKDQLEGNWEQLKGSVRTQWGKLTNDQLDQIEGNRQKLAGQIQEAYGVAKEEAEKQIKDWERRNAA